MWTHRIMLEARMSSDNAFVTLTYDDAHLPLAETGLPTLVPKAPQDWLKRLRKAIEPLRVRYYLVGEYGDETQRPHYHVALFNYPSCRHGISRYSRLTRNCCAQCDLVRDTWGLGAVMLGTLEATSCQYVAGYVMKKMTAKDDRRLLGRHPEFARMSLRPGIGHDALFEVASQHMKFDLNTPEGDVPSTLRHGPKELPLGRYLRRKLRKMVGRDEATPEAVMAAIEETLRPLREDAFNSSSSFKEALIAAGKGSRANLYARQKISKRRSSI